VKDRHNGNILLDLQGHIVHIDFGFIFCSSPGGLNFESSPFKFTQEYLDVLEGRDSDLFLYLKFSLLKGLLALQKHVQEIAALVCILQQDSDLPCFKGFKLEEFQARFRPEATYQQMEEYVQALLEESVCSGRTVMYDNFQWYSNGIKE
jgi:phosphatidylinositol kinase/protein kinase (PI-3  family)